MEPASTFRYEALAGHIVELVESGALLPGARAPSVRSISKARRVSISTVLNAYRLLEDRGVLKARPQSGYFVTSTSRVALETPSASRPPARAERIATGSLLRRMLEHGRDPRFAPLGCAIPSSEVLSAQRLDRLLAGIARQRGAELNTYTVPRGDATLRQAIARRAAAFGQVQNPEEIVITNGCTEALNVCLRAVTRPGDTVAVESPTYFGVLRVMEGLGLKALELPTDAISGVSVDALARAMERRKVAACVLSSSFLNPLGCTSSDEHKLALLDVLERHHVPLVEDDVYGDIHFGNDRPRPFQALRPSADTLYCSSFSKTLAPGYRIGWVAAGKRTGDVVDAQSATSLGASALPQAALAEFLSTGGFDRHLRRLRRAFGHNIERTRLAVEKAFPTDTRVSNPAGGFVVWLELPPPFDSEALFGTALGEGICFAPGNVFSPGGHFNHCLRLSCGHHWNDDMASAIARLGQLAVAQQLH